MKDGKWAFLPLIFSVLGYIYRLDLIMSVFVRRALFTLALGTNLVFYRLLKEPVLVLNGHYRHPNRSNFSYIHYRDPVKDWKVIKTFGA